MSVVVVVAICEPKIVPTGLLKLKNYENLRICVCLISQKYKKKVMCQSLVIVELSFELELVKEKKNQKQSEEVLSRV